MTVIAGNTIFASDYNTLRGEINQWFGDPNPSMVFGDGSQTQGWGGSMPAVVNIGDIISATQLNTFTDRCNIGEDIVNVVSGTLPQIAAGTIITAAGWNAIETKSDSIFTNRLDIEAAELSLIAGGSSARVASYSTAINCTFRYTSASFAAARYFWNSGGALNISGIISGYTLGWGYDGQGVNEILTGMGTVTMNYTQTIQSGAGGTPTSIGFYNLTTGFQTIFTQTGTGAYTNTVLTIEARYGGSGAWTELRVTITPDPARTVDGTTTITTQQRKLDNQSSGAASLSITAPVYSLIDGL